MDADDLDGSIGSMLEAWLTRDTGPRCRFDNVPLADRGLLQNPALRFCGPACREAFRKVQEARVVLGKRDLKRRGFD
jgi:hypothetical protein